METETIITAASTLAGVIISALLTFTIQNRVAERQRKWVLEDERRSIDIRREEEIHKQSRDLFISRVSLVEESIRLMNNYLQYCHARNIGIEIPPDEEKRQLQVQRMQEISGDAVNNIQLLELGILASWQEISAIYWGLINGEMLTEEEAKKSSDLFLSMMNTIDQLRNQLNLEH